MKLPNLNEAQLRAILLDERAIEELDFRDRDELIIAGIVVRRRPERLPPNLGAAGWRTWITQEGLLLREQLAGEQ